MTWWDANVGRERSTLVHKLFYVWGWPVTRFLLQRCMTPEHAHWFAMHIGIRAVDALDRAWRGAVVVAVIVGLLMIRALLVLAVVYTEVANRRRPE